MSQRKFFFVAALESIRPAGEIARPDLHDHGNDVRLDIYGATQVVYDGLELRRRPWPTSASASRREEPIAKYGNTYAKRQREQNKKERADKKREKREQRRQGDKSRPTPAE